MCYPYGMTTKVSPVDIIKYEFCVDDPHELSQKLLISHYYAKLILEGKMQISIYAERLGRAFGTSPEFWVNLENNFLGKKV
jgi:plasmid maintenance system antidote protein VapI